MKRLFLFIAIVAALSIVMCCSNEGDDTTPKNTTSASIEQSETGYAAATRALTMSATSSTYYTAQVKEGKDWCTFDAGKTLLMGEIEGGQISLNIHLKANTSAASRQAKIWVGFDNGDEFDLTITQAGNPNGTDEGDNGSGDDSGDDGTGDDGTGDDGTGDDGTSEEAVFEIDGKGNYVVEAEGGTVSVKVTTNLEYSVNIPEEAREWLSVVDARAVRVENITFAIAENVSSDERVATVDLLDADKQTLQSITFKQSGATNDGTGDDGTGDDGTTEDDGRITIAQAKATTLNTEVKVKESTVVAVSTKSYLLYDESDYILVYKNDTPEFEVGDRVEVEATVTEYGDVVQLQYPTATKVGQDVSFEHPTADEFSGSDAEAFLTNPYIKYVKLCGTLNKNSNYYNIALADSSSAMASLAYPSSEMCPDSYDGQELEIYGYTIYVTKSKYVYVIATGVEVVESGSGDDGSGDSGDSGSDGSGDDGGSGDDSGSGDSGTTGGNGEAVFYRDWAELPLCDDRGSNFQYVSHGDISVGGKSNQRNFTMCFDKANKAAVWVAYPLHDAHVGSSGRTNAWQYDPKIATQYQPDLGKSYSGSYDRGHQLPSGSRTGSKEMNYATFYYSNMTPQASNFNQKGWQYLENDVRNNICSDTLYVVTGALFKGNNDSSIDASTTDRNGDVCPIPSHYFKVLLRTKSGSTGKAIKNITSASDVKAIAILLKHTSSITSVPASAFISVEELEEFSGFTFFPILNDAIETDVKKQCSRSSWDL